MRFAVGSVQRVLIILRPLLLLEIVIVLLFARNARFKISRTDDHRMQRKEMLRRDGRSGLRTALANFNRWLRVNFRYAPLDGLIGRSLWIAEDLRCCASG